MIIFLSLRVTDVTDETLSPSRWLNVCVQKKTTNQNQKYFPLTVTADICLCLSCQSVRLSVSVCFVSFTVCMLPRQDKEISFLFRFQQMADSFMLSNLVWGLLSSSRVLDREQVICDSLLAGWSVAEPR